VQVLTGLLLFASEATKCYGNPAFRIKMLLLLLAGANALVFHLGSFRRVSAWDSAAAPAARSRVRWRFCRSCCGSASWPRAGGLASLSCLLPGRFRFVFRGAGIVQYKSLKDWDCTTVARFVRTSSVLSTLFASFAIPLPHDFGFPERRDFRAL